MTPLSLSQKADGYLQHLCLEIPNRRVGSSGNRAATAYFAQTIESFGLETDCPEFDCMDWVQHGAELRSGGQSFEILPSPYALGCRLQAPLVVLAADRELEAANITGKIVLLRGELAKEQLMPKNFPFYNPERHQKIIQLLERKQPAAVLAATSRDPGTAGGIYPFPLIEDGDFDIPAAHMKDVEGDKLTAYAGQDLSLEIKAERVPTTGCNVATRLGTDFGHRVVVCAHIDAKIGTPGALDNATGVVVLLLLAELLADYGGKMGIEIVAFNGEDYYAAPGQIMFVQDNADRFEEILLGINLDAAGYQDGGTAYSLYNCPFIMTDSIHKAFRAQPGMMEGEPWYQSDHSIFIQNGRPALAVTSEQFMQLSTYVTHTPRDRPEIVDCDKLAHTALALRELLLELAASHPPSPQRGKEPR